MIIIIFKKWIFIGKVFYMVHLLERLVQLIINLQIKMKIDEIYKWSHKRVIMWHSCDTNNLLTVSSFLIWLARY